MVHGGNAPQCVCAGKKHTGERPDTVTPQPVLPGFSLLKCSGIYGVRWGLLMALSDALSSMLLY